MAKYKTAIQTAPAGASEYITPFIQPPKPAVDTFAGDLIKGIGKSVVEGYKTELEGSLSRDITEEVKAGVNRQEIANSAQRQKAEYLEGEGQQAGMLYEQTAEFQEDPIRQDPLVQNFQHEMLKYDRMSKRGALSKDKLRANIDKITRQHIAQSPGMASEFRAIRGQILGDWTGELALAYPKVDEKGKKKPWEEAFSSLTKDEQVVITDPRGNILYEQSFKASQERRDAQREEKALLNLQDQNKVLKESEFVQYTNTQSRLLGSHVNQINSALVALANTDPEKFIEIQGQVSGFIVSGKENVDIALDMVTVDESKKKATRDYLYKRLDNLHALYSDPELSIVKQNARALTYMQDTLKMDALQSADVIFKIKEVGGDAAIAAIMEGQLYSLSPEKRSKIESALGTILSGTSQQSDMSQLIGLMEGNETYDTLGTEERYSQFNKTSKLMETYQSREKIQGVELNSWANNSAFNARVVDGYENQETLRKFHGTLGGAKWRKTFDQLKTKGDTLKTEIVADTMSRSIATNVPLMLSHALKVSQEKNYKFNVTYNRDSGKFKAVFAKIIGEGKHAFKTTGFAPQVPKELVQTVNALNEALSTGAHIKDHGTYTKQFSTEQTRQFLAESPANPEGVLYTGTDYLKDLPRDEGEAKAEAKLSSEDLQQGVRELIAKTQISLEKGSRDALDAFLETLKTTKRE